MASHEKEELYNLLRIDPPASTSDIQRAYKRLALQYHPERGDRQDPSLVAKFEEVTCAYWALTTELNDDRKVDSEQIFFNLFKDVLLFRKGGGKPNADDMYIEDDEESDTGETEFDDFVEIIQNCRKRGKPVPDGFTDEKLAKLKETLLEEKELYKQENSANKDISTKVKLPSQVPVSRPKPKSKKQKAAEQRRREKEMEAIAGEIAEKAKLEEEKAEKKKQAEVEKQKRLEVERARQAAEDKKKRNKEERERIEREKREKAEEQERQKEEEERRKKEEKKKQKAAAQKQKQQAEQKAKEESERQKKEQASAKQKSILQQQQQQQLQQKEKEKEQLQKEQKEQQRNYPPREVPPRFAQKQQQQKQQKMQAQKVVSKPAANSHWLSGLGLGGYAGWDPLDHTGSGGGGGGGVGGWTDTDTVSHQSSEGQEIGTWQNPQPPRWGNTGNEIIVDSKDKEAWPSIGDQSESTSEAGDTDNASVSGSVISSSSNPGQGQGQESSGQGSSAIQGQSASGAWGVSPRDEKMDSNSTWGMASGLGSSTHSQGWGTPSPNTVVNNQGANMQSNHNNHSGGDYNPLNSNPGSMGWGGMNNTSSAPGGGGGGNRPQGSMQQAQQGGRVGVPGGKTHGIPNSSGAQCENNGVAGMAGGSQSAADNTQLPWGQGGMNLSAGLSGLQSKASSGRAVGGGVGSGVGQDSGWNMPAVSISRGGGGGVVGGGAGNPMEGSIDSSESQGGSVDHWGNGNGGGTASSGWGAPGAQKPNSGGWGTPNPSPNSNSGEWGANPSPRTSSNPQSGWGNPNPPQQQQQQQQQQSNAGQWGGGNPHGPNSASPQQQQQEQQQQQQQQQSSSQQPPVSQPMPNTWAQAAGKGLNTNTSSKPGSSPATDTAATINRSHQSTELDDILQSKDGWGCKPVRQDTSWDVPDDSPRTKRKSIVEDNVWNQPKNDGTGIWEASRNQQQQHQQQQQQQQHQSHPQSNWNPPPGGNPTGAGGPPPGPPPPGKSNWDNNDQDSSNTWGGGPPQKPSNTWDGGPPTQGPPPTHKTWDNPPSNQWGTDKPPPQSKPWGNNGNGNVQPPNNWPGANKQPGNPNNGNQWGPPPRKPENSWESGNPGEHQGGGHGGPGWGGNGNGNNGGGGRPDPTGWGEPSNGNKPDQQWDKPKNGGQQQQQQQQQQQHHPSAWGKPDSWGGGSNSSDEKRDTGNWGAPPPNTPMHNPNQNPPPKGGWENLGNIKPTGWDEPSPPTQRKRPDIDDGTSMWGDPGQHKQPPSSWGDHSKPPPQSWGSHPGTPSTPLTPGAMPNTNVPPQQRKPSDESPWNKGPPPPTPTPSSRPGGPAGWGEPPPGPPPSRGGMDDGTQYWGPPQPPRNASGWGDSGSSQWPGAKPKTSTDSWGGNSTGDRNGPRKMGGESMQPGWADEGSGSSVWDDTDIGNWNGSQENNNPPSWSSARGVWMKNPSLMKKPGAKLSGVGNSQQPQMRSKMLQSLMDMGFSKEASQNALISNNMNLDSAIRDLVSDASRSKEKEDLGGEMLHKSRMQQSQQDVVSNHSGDDMPDPQSDVGGGGQFVPPLSMANAQVVNNSQTLGKQQQQQQQQGPSLVPTSLNMANSSINPSLQQRLLLAQQHNLSTAPPPSAAPPQMMPPGPPPPAPSSQSVQQQMALQQIEQQLRIAVQTGLISPQIITQQHRSPEVLKQLQQLLQLQEGLRRMMAQQQVYQQNKASMNMAHRQAYEQINNTIIKVRAQIVYLQQQISQYTSAAAATQPISKPQDTNNISILQSNISSLSLNKSEPQSRLNQWKLPSPDKEGIDTIGPLLSKAPGSKPLHQSHSTPNLQRNLESLGSSLSLGENSPWSNTSSTSHDWPTSSAITFNISQSDGKDFTRESLSSVSSNTTSTFSINDMIPEFVPGKPWQGLSSKNIEDDPNITPGSVARPFSVNTIKDEHLINMLSSKSSPMASLDSSTSSTSWNTFPKPPGGSSSGVKPTWSSDAMTPTSLSTELWKVPSKPTGASRPPPGLGNPNKTSLWQQQQQQQNYNRSNSWTGGGDRSAFTAVGGVTSGWDNSRSNVSPFLVLKNLTPQIDGSTLKTLCMQHGPLVMFILNLHYGQAIVRYHSKEEAYKAQKSLNTCVLGNTTILAEFVNEADVSRLVEQNNPAGPPPPVQQQQQQQPPQQQSLWSHSSQQQQQQQQQSYRSSSKSDSNQWNGANLSGFQSSMWGSGGGLWGAPSLDDHRGGGVGNTLLPGDLLSGESH